MMLAGRRRALMMEGVEKEGLLYHLPASVVNAEHSIFDTGVNPITKDRSFTIHTDLSANYRNAAPVVIGKVSTSGAYIQTKVRNGLQTFGGVGLVQIDSVPFLWSKKSVNTGMTATVAYRFRLCITHTVGANFATLYLRLGSDAVQIFTSPTEEFIFPADGSLFSLFKGTLNVLDVYPTALSEAECRALIE